MKIYQAGPLFTVGERDFNRVLAEILRRAGHEVFLPQEHELAGESEPREGKRRRIFFGDVAGMDWSDSCVAVLDGSDVDSGTAWECGYEYKSGKPIFGLRTDFRSLGDEGTCNIMVEQSVVGAIYSNISALVRAVDIFASKARTIAAATQKTPRSATAPSLDCGHGFLNLILPPDRRETLAHRWECSVCFRQYTQEDINRVVNAAPAG